MKFLDLFTKYFPLVVVGVHAASTVDASNSDRRAVVISEVTGITDAVAQASGNPTVIAVATMVDLGASVINALMAKKPAPPAAPAVILGNLSGVSLTANVLHN